MKQASVQVDTATRNVEPHRLLYSLMATGIIMPMAGWMFGVSLPTIRDDLGIAADVAAWIGTAFSLPFMIMMPVYGRISEGLGKRRLLLWGIAIFIAGTLVATFSVNLQMLIVGRIIQGFGVAGLLPLALALITEVFPAAERGKALGQFSTMGPITGVIGPVLAGFIVSAWGWRSSFVPAMLVAAIGFAVVSYIIPSSFKRLNFGFLRQFDWLGVGLLALTLTFLLFFFSSRPITGRAPFTDLRLLGMMLIFLALFVWHELRRDTPFIRLTILRNRSLVIGSFAATLRMVGMSGAFGFMMPLYLTDVVGLEPEQLGFYLMANPAMMIIFVGVGGRISDRVGSRWLVVTAFAITASVMFSLTRLGMNTPAPLLIGLIGFFGVGAGLMLASIHRAALNDVPEEDVGTASGVYSMIRFLGSTSGGAIGGVLILTYSNAEGVATLSTYQNSYMWYMGFALAGVLIATLLPRSKYG